MRPEAGMQGNISEGGWALASVLWAVAMLSLMAAAAQDLSITSHKTESRAWDRARAGASLNAAIVDAVLGIASPAAGERWRVDGASREVQFSGFAVKVTVQAESGRYDLNAVDGSVLTALLRSQGADADRATALSDSILDWRSLPGPHRLNGATDDDYAGAGLSYRPRHAPFQSVEELRLVLGMTPDLFRRIRPALTVYTKRGAIDPALAPREALLALYNGDEDHVDSMLKARDEGDDSGFAIYVSSHQGVINPGISLTGQVFDIQAQTWMQGRVYRREEAVAFTGSDRPPLIRLAWQEH